MVFSNGGPELRRTRLVGAAFVGLLIAGCAGTGNTPSDGSGRTTVSAAGVSSAARSGTWRAWTTANSAQEGLCQATAHQVVCGTRSGGLLGRSRNTGKVTWSVPATGSVKKPVLVVDAADERAVAGGGEILRAANLRTGRAAWTHRLADGSISAAISASDRTVYALETLAKPSENVVLRAFRASDGKQLWHRTVDADPYGDLASFGGRVYITDGTRVTARDARTGAAVAVSPRTAECPNLVSGGGYLVCTGSPYSAMDYFPPLQRLDPVSLKPLPTAEGTGMLPARGLISADGVLMLCETSAEDPGGCDWNAYDLVRHRKLWSYPTTTYQAGITGGRFVTFTPDNDRATKGRVITIDLRKGPQATGSAAPRMSPAYPQARGGEHPGLVVPLGSDAGHIVIQAAAHRSLRSVPLP